eukprot:jgi/Picre1/30943/NNA_006302.t1
MAEFLIGLDWLIQSFGEDGWARQYLNEGLEMPKILLGYLYIVRDRILEQGIFGQGSSWHFASMMESRSRVLVNHLCFGNVFLECSWRKKERMSQSMAAAVLKLLDSLLTNHFGIVFYTHATAIILCSIFCTAKTKNDFRKIGPKEMDLRQFYNTVFLAVVSSYSEKDLFGETLLACKTAHLEITCGYGTGIRQSWNIVVQLMSTVVRHKSRGVAPLGMRERLARWYFQQLICAVDFCHKLGIANRDIKMDNILLCGTGEHQDLIKLTDFGLSKDDNAHSPPNTCLGTVVYFAPEIIRVIVDANKEYDARKSDVWSCGIVLYAMVSGKFPFGEAMEASDPSSVFQGQVGVMVAWSRIYDIIRSKKIECVVKSFTTLETYPSRAHVLGGERPVEFNKVFASVWYDANSVLFGTKCNRLLMLDMKQKCISEIRKPDEKVGSEDVYSPNRFSSAEKTGIHALSLNPSRTLIATGGTDTRDLIVLDGESFKPRVSLLGHTDWVFGCAWISDQHLASASKDCRVALWNVKSEHQDLSTSQTDPLMNHKVLKYYEDENQHSAIEEENNMNEGVLMTELTLLA